MYTVEYNLLCRLCLDRGDRRINIFDPKGTDGFLVWKIIRDLVESEVSEEDGLPQTICRDCMTRLAEFKFFKSICINSRIHLLKHQPKERFIELITIEEDAPDVNPSESINCEKSSTSDDPQGDTSKVPVQIEEDVADDVVDRSDSISDDEYEWNKSQASVDDANSQDPVKGGEYNTSSLEEIEKTVGHDGHSLGEQLDYSDDTESEIHLFLEEDDDGDQVSEYLPRNDDPIPEEEPREKQIHLFLEEEDDGEQVSECLPGNDDPIPEEEPGEKQVSNVQSRRLGIEGCHNLNVEEGIRTNLSVWGSKTVGRIRHSARLRCRGDTQNSDSSQMKVVCRSPSSEKRGKVEEKEAVGIGFVESRHEGDRRAETCKEQFYSGVRLFKLACEKKCQRSSEETYMGEYMLNIHGNNVMVDAPESSQCDEGTVEGLNKQMIGKGIEIYSDPIVSISCFSHPCHVCRRMFLEKDHLRSHVRSSHLKLGISCYFCGEVFGEKSVLFQHIQTHKSVKSLECSQSRKGRHSCTTCDKRCTLLRHRAEVHEGKTPHLCKVCSKSFSHRSDLLRHMASVHEGDKHLCSICSKGFSTKSNLRIHMASVHEGKKPHLCKVCSKSFSHRSTLLQHMASVHEGDKHLCSICSKGFSSKCNLRRHMASVHEGKTPHLCKVCSKSFSRRSTLLHHMASVHEGDKHLCSICSKGFSTKCYLRTHMASVHEGKKPHFCKVCSKSFSVRSTMLQHMASVHEGDKHLCSICSKGFFSKCNLRRHMASVHEGKKPHVCKVCSKSFSQRCILLLHISSVHEGDKHVCNICFKGFSRGSYLRTHTASVHEGKKPHLCKVCSKSYAVRSTLLHHIASVHKGKKPLLCKVCSKSFSHSSTLLQHMASVH